MTSGGKLAAHIYKVFCCTPWGWDSSFVRFQQLFVIMQSNKIEDLLLKSIKDGTPQPTMLARTFVPNLASSPTSSTSL